ncbi:hypothetical protein [Coralloluteibacterium thermophilus]|uniref:HEAT repeat domain-containing protein n=1 Tax=Coralloluteibacterium thermophilum TaxID=2707049 RepID=A0ABV9NL50_9GAMM
MRTVVAAAMLAGAAMAQAASDPAEALAAYHADTAAALAASPAVRDRVLALRFEALGRMQEGEEAADAERLAALVADAGADPRALAWLAAEPLLAPSQREAVLARLLAVAPDDLNAHLLAIAMAAAGGEPARVTAAVEAAAARETLDAGSAELLSMYVELLARHPLPAVVVAAMDEAAGGAVASEAYAFALWSRDVPPYRPLLRVCEPTAVADDPARDAACQRLGRRLFEQGDLILAQTVGYAVLYKLVDPAEAAPLAEGMRRIEWQQESVGRLIAEPGREQAHLREWLAAMRRPGSTESANAAAFLARAGRPLDPPDDWRSVRERGME